MASLILFAMFGALMVFLATKKPWITHTLTVVRITEDGEQVSANLNFTAFDSLIDKKCKVDEIFAITDARKAQNHARMMEIMASAEKEKKLEAVK